MKSMCLNCAKKEVFCRGLCNVCYMRAYRGRINFPISNYYPEGAISPKTAEIIECLKHGMKQSEIAEKFGVSKQYVFAMKQKYCPYQEIELGNVLGIFDGNSENI